MHLMDQYLPVIEKVGCTVESAKVNQISPALMQTHATTSAKE